jgi:hypothetical protein
VFASRDSFVEATWGGKGGPYCLGMTCDPTSPAIDWSIRGPSRAPARRHQFGVKGVPIFFDGHIILDCAEIGVSELDVTSCLIRQASILSVVQPNVDNLTMELGRGWSGEFKSERSAHTPTLGMRISSLVFHSPRVTNPANNGGWIR